MINFLIMTLSIPVPAKILSVDQLVEIFHLFCKAYDIEPDERDGAYFSGQGIRLVNSGSTLDYRPFMGAKFFAVGNDDNTEFWGYTSDDSQPKQAEEFGKLVMDYLGEKPE